MKARFSKTWKSSKQPRKQRKFRANAPLHIKGKFLSANLSKELRKKYGTRSLRLRVGDKVKVLRGNFKGREGTIDEVNLQDSKVYISKLEVTKREGAKVRAPLSPSNLQITELKLEDKKRKAKLAKLEPKSTEPKQSKEKGAK